MTGRVAILTAMGLGLLAASCQPAADPPSPPIRLGTTTSTENSGLLARLLPPFEKRFGVEVHVIPVGTGHALTLARNGDVDVVLVHSPEAEEQFVREGSGVNRRSVMWNDFIIVGPAADPAGVAKAASAAEALARIARTASPFTSRGDESGTHLKEKALWQAAHLKPAGAWYLETGQGMGATLLVAGEKDAYCLADRGTYLFMKSRLRLAVLFQDGPDLRNPYSVIAVNPARHRQVNYLGAMRLVAWLTSPEGQQIIADYRADGEVLFHPTAVPEAGSAKPETPE